LNRVRQKLSVYDVLSPCGWPILYGRLHPAYACENHEQISCGGCGADTFFFYLALLIVFPFTNVVSCSVQPGTIPASCERTAKVGVFRIIYEMIEGILMRKQGF
jgi:hypothetical protein